MDRQSKQNINKETLDFNDILDQMHLTGIFKAFHTKAGECIFFSSVHGTFSRIYYMLGHKWSLNKFKKIKIIPSSFANHSDMKLEIND